jgi:hypothetical protein
MFGTRMKVGVHADEKVKKSLGSIGLRFDHQVEFP